MNTPMNALRTDTLRLSQRELGIRTDRARSERWRPSASASPPVRQSPGPLLAGLSPQRRRALA